VTALLWILALPALLVLAAWCLIAQPTLRENRRSPVAVDDQRLRAHVGMLSRALHPRDSQHPENLERCADFIGAQFSAAGLAMESQWFDVHGTPYRNVIGRFGAGKGSKVVVGAHYDAFGDTPGADDNASGVAALIELAYLLGKQAPDREIELVAYVLEEPPFFRTPSMGSAIHAKRLAAEKASLAGVIVLETIGYFREDWGSQSYPSALFRLFYPSRGNFVAVVGRSDQGGWIKTVKAGMKGATDLPVYSVRAPSSIPGIDFSDHASYWPYSIDAVMITDTAFYRNRAYHAAGDTPDTLDYARLSKVVVAVHEALRSR
jgi:Zn-dependent M28 family amino/carboxypeptidase